MLLLEGFCPPSRVVLPQEDRLVVDESHTRSCHDLTTEFFALQQIEEIQTHGVLQELGKLWLLPIQKILEIVHETWILEVVTLRKNCGRHTD